MAKPYVLEAGAGSLVEFYDWMKQSNNGDVLIYWTGDLQNDRQAHVDPYDIDAAERRIAVNALNVTASAVLRAAEEGLVALTQKRLEEGVYEYRATRIRRAFDKLQLKQFTRPNVELALA